MIASCRWCSLPSDDDEDGDDDDCRGGGLDDDYCSICHCQVDFLVYSHLFFKNS